MDRRRAFVVGAGSLLLLIFALLVIRPAIERGGPGEILIVVVIFGGILLFERYLRSR